MRFYLLTGIPYVVALRPQVKLLQAPKTKKLIVPGCGSSPGNGTGKPQPPIAGSPQKNRGYLPDAMLTDGENNDRPGYKLVNGKTVAVADGG